MTAEQALAFAGLVEAAERGDGVAACRLGDMYRVGEGGLRYSSKQTFRWYSRSALAGDANGQCNLGACYEHGLGCTQSYLKAVKWYRLSAAQWLGTASMNFGYCTLRGHGVPANKTEALRLFRLAVAQGEAKAVPEVERLEETRQEPKVTIVRGVQFRDETEAGHHLGVVGVGGVAAVPPWQDEQIRRELLEVLKYDATDGAHVSDAATASREITGSRRES
jgi:hypothetical protein